MAGLESGEHTDGACPGLMKWVGWAGGQKWFEVPLRNMEAVGGESLWEKGRCLLCLCSAPNTAGPRPVAWAPWDCFDAESGKPNCSPLGTQ